MPAGRDHCRRKRSGTGSRGCAGRSQLPPSSSIPGFPGSSPATLRSRSSDCSGRSRRPFARRPSTRQLSVMAEADERDLLPHIVVPTLLIWGELDGRSPLAVARQFEQAIHDTELVVIPPLRSLQQPRPARALQRGRAGVLPRSSIVGPKPASGWRPAPAGRASRRARCACSAIGRCPARLGAVRPARAGAGRAAHR
jgi:hypothetical protein